MPYTDVHCGADRASVRPKMGGVERHGPGSSPAKTRTQSGQTFAPLSLCSGTTGPAISDQAGGNIRPGPSERNCKMSTHVATSNPVRSDVFTTEDQPAAPARRNNSRLWALSGLGAGILGIGTIATSSMVDVVYRDEFKGTTEGFTQALDEKTGVLFAFHSITTLSA